jgi:HSP20 family protein
MEFAMFYTPVSALRNRLAYVPIARSLDRSVERFLQHAFNAPAPAVASEQASTSQDDKAYTLTFDMPGVAKDQLNIQIEANQVRIETKPDASRSYRAAYEFAADIDSAASEAKLENGVLTLKLAKQVPQSNAVSLAIA